MFKKVLQIAMTLSVLLGGYAVYRRGFTVLASRLGPPRVAPLFSEGIVRTKTAEEADQLALRGFGPEHWSVRPDQSFRYYSSEKNYWMYAKDYKRSEDGKQITLTPFALVWMSKDRKSIKTMAGDRAEIEFDRPFEMGKPGAGEARLIRGRIIDDVRIRDDKGTPTLDDDLTIGPLASLEFDGTTDQIRSDSPVVIRDRDMTATGVGLRIDLRPREGAAQAGGVGSAASGYAGARTVYLLSKAHIVVKDVGRTGIVPGVGAKARQASDGPRPGDVQSDGPMRIDLPLPRPIVWCGPPIASEPTLVHFKKNVKVRQGDPNRPDQCDADELHLTFIPNEDLPSTPAARALAESKDQARKLAEAKARTQAVAVSEMATEAVAKTEAIKPESSEGSGAMTSLALVKAEATGHAVWLQSPSQGTEAFGNQLIYERHAPVAPDMVYFRGEKYTDVKKINTISQGPLAGQVQSIDKIRTTDLTLYQFGQGPATVIARGPGRLETRPAADKPIERIATWGERLVMQTIGQGTEERRRVTLTGSPSVSSPSQGVLQARDTIIAYLKPKDRDADRLEVDGKPTASAATASSANGDSSRIERVEAKGDVVMVIPGKAGTGTADPNAPSSRKTLRAKERFDAVFDDPPVASAPKANASLANNAPVLPDLNAEQPRAETVAKEPDPKTVKPSEPDMDISADVVWALVASKGDAQGPSGKSTVKEARLRGNVKVHQGPASGKARGTDLTAANADLLNQGDGRLLLRAHGTEDRPAHFASDEMTIQGPILGFDQENDYTWVEGPGRLTQENVKGLMADAKPANANVKDKDKDKDKALKIGTMDITWLKGMKFYGRPTDDEGRPASARAEFDRKVHAETPDSTVDCDRMIAYLDRPVSFLRPQRDPDDPRPTEPEPKPQIVTVRCFDDVLIVNRKVEPTTGLLVEKQRVQGQNVTYHKPTGEFQIEGVGVVDHYSRGKPEQAGARPTVATASRTGTERTTRLKPAADPKNSPLKSRTQAAPPPLELTRIHFDKRMKGRFAGSEANGPNPARPGPRQADFFGGVRVLRAKVENEDKGLDADDPPADYLFMTAKAMRMSSEPAPRGSKEASATFLNAQGDARARTLDKAISGDQITYSSTNGLMYTYGHQHDVIVAQQGGIGQNASYARGSVVKYNLKTKQMELVDPKGFQMVDAESGARAVPIKPGKDKPEKEPKRSLNSTKRSDKERRGFGQR
ncbi:MAG: hypothetical protein ABI353_23830 [Isosphaeraceae bacterium]